MYRTLSHLPTFMRGNSGSSGQHHRSWQELSPQPVPDNLCDLRGIVADISRAVDQSPYVSAQIKAILRDCTRQLEAECATLKHMTQLAHRAANDASNVLHWRIRFFKALDDRILELSRLREGFVDSRRAFRDQPTNLLTVETRNARGRIQGGMLSGLKPLFDKIDKYYNEVNVSLRAEQDCLQKIRSSLRVTPDDRIRWEHIRDACQEAYDLLKTEMPLPPPHMPQPRPNNKAARNIKVLAQTVTDARQSLLQAHRDVTDLTRHPQFGLLRLQSEYENGEETCRQRIGKVLQFSEQFLHSFAEVPPLDDFRNHLLPTTAASSSRVLQDVSRQMKSITYAVQSALPQLRGLFDRFNHSLPIAATSMQRMYSTLQGLVQPLDQPDDPHQGVFRTMEPGQLKEEQRHWRGLEEQWAAQLRI